MSSGPLGPSGPHVPGQVQPTQTAGRPSGGTQTVPSAPEQPSRRRFTPEGPRRVVRRRATVRKVDPWSVLKLSLVFYFCVLLIVTLGLVIFWMVVLRLGIIEALQELLLQFQFELTDINGANLLRIIFLVGLLNVVLWSGVNVFLAFLYNLVADLIGGLRGTLAEEE